MFHISSRSQKLKYSDPLFRQNILVKIVNLFTSIRPSHPCLRIPSHVWRSAKLETHRDGCETGSEMQVVHCSLPQQHYNPSNQFSRRNFLCYGLVQVPPLFVCRYRSSLHFLSSHSEISFHLSGLNFRQNSSFLSPR